MTDLSRIFASRVQGDVLFDNFSRARYANDASFYQMMPLGILSPKSEDDIRAAIDIATDQGIPILARGGGSSQCGQTVNEALVIDNTQHFNDILELDIKHRTEMALAFGTKNDIASRYSLLCSFIVTAGKTTWEPCSNYPRAIRSSLYSSLTCMELHICTTSFRFELDYYR